MTGIVEWFEPRKGYGFICPNDATDHIFFHRTEFQEDLHPSQGDWLVFDISPGEKGNKAINIQRL